MTRLEDLNILVTGATGGIGSAVAQMLADRGARVAVTSREKPKAEALRDRLASTASTAGTANTASSAGHVAEVMDVTDEESVATAVDRVRQAMGRIDVLVNVPGLSVPGKISEMSVADYDRTMSVNTRGMFLVAKHFVKQVDPVRGGLVIGISSVAGRTANPNAPVYCAAKAALGMLMSGLAMQVKQQNIKVTTLLPGAVTTKGFWGDRPVPHDKFLLPQDVAEAVCFVCSLPSRVVMHEMTFEPWEFFKTK